MVVGCVLGLVCVCTHTHNHARLHTETHHLQACAVWLIANTCVSAGSGLSPPFEAMGLVAPLPVSTVRK